MLTLNHCCERKSTVTRVSNYRRVFQLGGGWRTPFGAFEFGGKVPISLNQSRFFSLHLFRGLESVLAISHSLPEMVSGSRVVEHQLRYLSEPAEKGQVEKAVPEIGFVFRIEAALLNVSKWFTHVSKLLAEISPEPSEER
jgi:hypothetical protein